MPRSSITLTAILRLSPLAKDRETVLLQFPVLTRQYFWLPYRQTEITSFYLYYLIFYEAVKLSSNADC